MWKMVSPANALLSHVAAKYSAGLLQATAF
jgi:hypothetical protein